MKVGDKVVHKFWRNLGVGEVVRVNSGTMVDVAFTKGVASEYPIMNLKPVDGKKPESKVPESPVDAPGDLQRVGALLDSKDFLGAAALAKELDISSHRYLRMKGEAVGKLFVDAKGESLLSQEQAFAVAATERDTLIKARAGSGKTHVLLYKLLFLVKYCGVDPNKILVLTFNRSAADGFAAKVKKLEGVAFNNAMTFHGLSYSIARTKKKIKVVSNDPGRYAKKELSKKIEGIIDRLWRNKEISSSVVSIFRDAFYSFAYIPSDMTTKEYMAMRRNIKKVTLGGDYVKSFGEKIVGDFLFEYGIEYEYEAYAYRGKRNIRPDFTILNYAETSIVIEYWGVSFDDPRLGVPDGWRKNREEYLQEREMKLDWYAANGIKCIEVSYDDMRKGRDFFENKLKEELCGHGIQANKLEESVIVERVYRNHIKKFTLLCTGFIQKAKQNCLTPSGILERLEQMSGMRSVRVGVGSRVFIECGAKIFGIYQQDLAEEKCLDFDDLIVEATGVVQETKGKCLFGYGQDNKPLLPIGELEYIFIDEFQDFSLLFYNLLSEMRVANSHFKVIAVGDDWQAINRFAGSDTRYINNFSKWFPGGDVIPLLTNRRSAKSIVAYGNRLMSGWGEQSKPLPDKPGGQVVLVTPSPVGCEYIQKVLKCQEIRQTVADHLNFCLEILKQYEGKTVGFLYRNNSFYGVELSQFSDLLIRYGIHNGCKKSELERRVVVTTIHQLKGDERDVIVIMDVTDSMYPFFHEFAELYSFLFNESLVTVEEDERRLFYVAITRAKSTLYICRTQPFSRFLSQ